MLIMSESNMSKNFKLYCEERNVMCLKVIAESNRGLPDRLVIGSGFLFWVEFKVEGKKPTMLQRNTHCRLNTRDQHVYCFDNLEDAKKTLDSFRMGQAPKYNLTLRGMTELL